MIRQHALGRFEDLLVASATHPAMSLYLDNWRSTRGAPNENQGRELLELHTVGTGAGYTEDMVKDSAKLLSGYSVALGRRRRGLLRHREPHHRSGDGPRLHPPEQRRRRPARAEAYLRYLANHPATARVVATRLAVRFVSDLPSQALVDHLAQVFLASGTDIRATLRALVAHPEFRGSAGAKVSTPVDDMIATSRRWAWWPASPGAAAVLPVRTGDELRPRRAAPVQLAASGRGAGDELRVDLGGADAAVLPDALAARRRLLPRGGASYVAARYRIPRSRITFDLYFDHLSRSLLGRRSTARSLEAACVATGLTPRTVITPHAPPGRVDVPARGSGAARLSRTHDAVAGEDQMSDDIEGHEGCAEFERASRLSRRGFMQGMAAGTGAMVATQMFGDAMMEASFGATGGNVLVVLSFRGGIDGLGVVVPHGDPDYYRARPSLAVSKTSVLAGDAMFGLHPKMAPLLPLWNARKMAAVHAVGMEVPNRSHFKAIELIEDSSPGSRERRGWVNRMIGAGGIVGPTEAVHLSSPLTPTHDGGAVPDAGDRQLREPADPGPEPQGPLDAAPLRRGVAGLGGHARPAGPGGAVGLLDQQGRSRPRWRRPTDPPTARRTRTSARPRTWPARWRTPPT